MHTFGAAVVVEVAVPVAEFIFHTVNMDKKYNIMQM